MTAPYFIEYQSRTNDPIEVAIAEARALFLKRFGITATVVRININNPRSVAVEGVTVEFVRGVLPGAAWAGRVE